MTLFIRRIISITFILLFLITAPVLLLYSMGYRFNAKKNKVEFVGALFLDSHPKNVKININKKPSEQSMPAKIVNIIPGTYDILIEKEGYHSWSKKLEVLSKQTTFANNIILFKKSMPEILFWDEINILKTSPDNNKLIYSKINNSWEEIWIMDLSDTNNTNLLYRTSITNKDTLKNKNIWWSHDNRKVLIYNGQDYFILNTLDPDNIIFIRDFSQINLSNIKWDARNSNILYGTFKKDIYQINLDLIKIEKIAFIPISTDEYKNDYLVKNGSLYYLNFGDKSVRLESVTINENPIPKNILEIPITDDIKIINHNENFISLQSKSLQKIYLLKLDSEVPRYDTLDAKELVWNFANTKILYFNDFEIWSADINPGKDEFLSKYLLARGSDIIKNSVWHNEAEYLIYSTDNKIQAIELDGRDKRNTATLIENAQVSQIFTDPSSFYVYYVGKDADDKIGLFSLQIAEPRSFIDVLGI